MYTYGKAITSNIWCRVDRDPLNYCGKKACSYRLLAMLPSTLLLVSSELCVDLLDTAPLPPDLDAGVPYTALLLLTGNGSLDPYLVSP